MHGLPGVSVVAVICVLVAVIIFRITVYFISKVSEWNFESRTPSDGCRTDWGQMSDDLASGKTKSEVMRKSNVGGYDIKK